MTQILSVNVAILADNCVLLIQRADFAVWALPGGKVELGETPAAAAIREVREEVGLDVWLTRLVGVYSTPNWVGGDMHQLVFAARVLSSEVRPALREVLTVEWAHRAALPEPLLWGQHQQVLDALNGSGGSAVWTQAATVPNSLRLNRQELLAQHNLSRLAPQAVYQQLVAQLGAPLQHQDVSGRSTIEDEF